jgi:hypothetical protein
MHFIAGNLCVTCANPHDCKKDKWEIRATLEKDDKGTKTKYFIAMPPLISLNVGEMNNLLFDIVEALTYPTKLKEFNLEEMLKFFSR